MRDVETGSIPGPALKFLPRCVFRTGSGSLPLGNERGRSKRQGGRARVAPLRAPVGLVVEQLIFFKLLIWLMFFCLAGAHIRS